MINGRSLGLGEILKELPGMVLTPEGQIEMNASSSMEGEKDINLEECVSIAEAERCKSEQLLQRRQYRASAAACQKGLDALKNVKPEALYGIVQELKAGLCCGAARAMLELSKREGTSNRLTTCQEARELSNEAIVLLTTEVAGSVSDLQNLRFEALLLRGRANASAGDLDAARTDIEDALCLKPDDREANREMESVLERHGQVRILAVQGFKQSETATSIDEDEGIADGSMVSRLSDQQAKPRRGGYTLPLPPRYMLRGERQ